MAEQRTIPSTAALRAATALASILRDVGGDRVYLEVKHDGTARVTVLSGKRAIGEAVLATRETGSDEWVVVAGGNDG